MAIDLHFECASMSIEGHFYRIALDGAEVRCDCGGYSLRWCSHIEATLVYGERGMVRPEHRERADAVMAAAAKFSFAAPPEWKAAWRKLLRWRGLTPTRVFHPSTVGESGRPVVCFTGAMPRPRKELAAEAENAGWEVIDGPHRLTAVLVAMDLNGKSGKLQFARRHGIPIVPLDLWQAVMSDGEIQAG